MFDILEIKTTGRAHCRYEKQILTWLKLNNRNEGQVDSGRAKATNAVDSRKSGFEVLSHVKQNHS